MAEELEAAQPRKIQKLEEAVVNRIAAGEASNELNSR